ncbi:MAG: hypothetical protein HKO95_09410 [Rhodobacteraceae bacterium]|nr:hypothetical protein [Alphaproteobacteria bacterium]NNF72162.1 hypothetical protein [Paracoccaceae bacterium]NNK66943.1 hypothetical protein [Paracoccaceae bacterium]
MQSRTSKKTLGQLRTGISALAIGCSIVLALGSVAFVVSAEPAFASSDGHSDGGDDHSHDDSDHGSGGKGKGGSGGHDDGGHDDGGHDDDGHDDGGHDGGSKGKGGEGGKGGSSDGRGAQKGKDTDRDRGQPPWAREGIPEIELGRLNVARAPSHVLDRAYYEALSNFTDDKVAFYNMSVEEAAAALRSDFRNIAMLDSPLQNLSLLRDIFQNGDSVLNTLDEVENDAQTLAAIFLGAASDKSIEIVPDTAFALSVILGYELSEAEAVALAGKAETIRAAIKDGHG